MFSPPPLHQLLLTRTQNRPNRPFAGGLAAYITIHQTGNPRPTADAHAHARWMAREAPYSWHATIDDHEVWQSLDWGEQGWHAGDGAGGPGNTTSIGLEICMHEGIDEAAADLNAAWLAARLRLDGHGYEGIVQHNHWTGKNCPALIRAEPGRWEHFLEQVARFEEMETRTRLEDRVARLEQRVTALEAALSSALSSDRAKQATIEAGTPS
ncbi:MAG: N-acetylmuramoyl-L-alanine amidase [Chloroflexi bacterium]|nr:N-acetylmuramoyl-L-alanine amidase [Chloroflexota bacterium]